MAKTDFIDVTNTSDARVSAGCPICKIRLCGFFFLYIRLGGL